MNRILCAGKPILLPDGTLLSEIVGPATFKREKLAGGSNVSVALGTIKALSSSEIHIHPIVSQVTFLLSGVLVIKMKSPQDKEAYTIQLEAQQSVLTQPGTFFQLINNTESDCQALYIVGPAFVFEADEKGAVLYNDALVLGKDWDALATNDWNCSSVGNLDEIKKNREASLGRLVDT